MTRRQYGIATVVAILLLITLFAVILRERRRQPEPVAFVPRAGSDCTVKRSSGKMADQYLPGILENGAEYELEENYYACHPPVDGEVAVVRVSKELPPLVRVIRGVPGDHFDLEHDSTGKRWNLRINGELIKDHDGAPYFFGAAPPPTLQLYVDARHGVLQMGEVILLSTRSPGNLDSASLGVMSTVDLLGRVSRSASNH